MLAGIGLLDVLAALYRTILIPDAVRMEYQRGATRGEPDIDALAWIQVRSVTSDQDVSAHLDAGEAAAISLARANGAILILLDDKQARNEAKRLGLAVAGSLAIALEAKRRGLIQQLTPYLDQMIAQGRYISPELRAQVLREAGELTQP